jgi:hypothetical protein
LAVDEGVCADRDGFCPGDVSPTCVSLSDATALGWLTVSSSTSQGAVVTFRNTGSRPVCLDQQAMYTSTGSQALMMDAAVVGAVIPAGGSYDLFYASWTTPNGSYQPYLGRAGWWCIEFGQQAASQAVYEQDGEGAPAVLAAFVAPGLSSRNVWAGTYGVSANYQVWSWQDTHAVFTLGKTAQDAGGAVAVQLALRNVGDVAGWGEVVDHAPAGWTVSGLPAGFTATPTADGRTQIRGGMAVGGATGLYTPAPTMISYTLRRANGADAGRVDLGAASVSWWDGAVPQTSASLRATAVGVDTNGDGYLNCP